MAIEAFADESFTEADDGSGFYVLAAALVENKAQDDIRDAMRRLHGAHPNTRTKLHFVKMDVRQKRSAAEFIAGLDCSYVVCVGSPVPRRKQERARVACLQALVFELCDQGIETLNLEARTAVLDRHDIRTTINTRFSLPKQTCFTAQHRVGIDEPLLWLADVVAGIVRADRLGQPAYRQTLAQHIHEIPVSTKC
jgi:hypothetical protein